MPDTIAFVNSILQHAGSYDYDPVKAHEYYERTKELKGRQSVGQLKTQKQKEGWSYVKSQVKDAKKTELDAAGEANKAAVEQLRSTGEQRREALTEKLKRLFEQISGNVEAEIKALPKNLSRSARAAAVARIRDDANANRETGRSGVDADREQVRTELKGSIDTARETYKKAREEIAAKYDNQLQSEFDAIRTKTR